MVVGVVDAYAEVEREVLLALVEEAELGALLGVDDGEDARDALAHVVDASELAAGASGNLKSCQFLPHRDCVWWVRTFDVLRLISSPLSSMSCSVILFSVCSLYRGSGVRTVEVILVLAP